MNIWFFREEWVSPPLEKGGRGDLITGYEMLKYNKALKCYSRELRGNLTDAEKFLWDKVRGRQLKECQFYRQKIIGNYIVDFYCPKARLIIELDGGQHYTEEGTVKDMIRDKYMDGEFRNQSSQVF